MAIIGSTSYAQSTKLYKGENNFPDTVLVLQKHEAIKVANRLIEAKTSEERLAASLKRESKTLELWEQTSKALKIADEAFDIQQRQILNLQEQLDLTEREKDRLGKVASRERRRGFWQGAGVGAVVTLVALIILD